MKKFLSIITIISMIAITTVAPASAADLSTNNQIPTKMTILKDLNIIVGDERGNLNLDKHITRAEFATIIIKMLNLSGIENSKTNFTDVPQEYWAVPYINTCVGLGIIHGNGDGTFSPENNVTYEQAVKMIMCSLGYGIVAEQKGGYPSGYLAVASNEGLLKNCPMKDTTRKTIFTMLYNALTINLFDQTSWGTDGKNVFEKTDDTILSSVYNIDKYVGVITDAPITQYSNNNNDDTRYNVTIVGYIDSVLGNQKIPISKSIRVKDDFDYNSLLGKKVVAYIGEDNKNNDKIFSIAEDEDNVSFTLSSKDLIEEDSKNYTKENYVYYYIDKNDREVYKRLNEDLQCYVNYDEDFLSANNTESIADLVKDSGYLTFIDNDDDGYIDVIIALSIDREAIIKDVSLNSKRQIVFDTYADSMPKTDSDTKVIVYKNGEKIDVSDIKVGDVISCCKLNDDVYIYYVSDNQVIGSVKGYSKLDNEVTINNKTYKISPFLDKEPSYFYDKTGTFYINVMGELAWNSTSVSNDNNSYGLLLGTYVNQDLDDEYKLKVMMPNGKSAIYPLYSKMKIYDNDKVIAASDKESYDFIVNNFGGSNKLTRETVVNSVYDITINNNKILKLKTFNGTQANYLNPNETKYKSNTMSYGSIDLDKNTTIFSITGNDEIIDEDNVEVGKAINFMEDGEVGYKVVGFTEEDEDYASFLVGFNVKQSVAKDNHVFIVKTVKITMYDDTDAVSMTGFINGEQKTYIIYNEDNDYSEENGRIANPFDIKKGDILLLGTEIEDGVVSDYLRLFNASTKTLSNEAAAGSGKDEIYNAYCPVTKYTSSKVYLDNDIANEKDVWYEASSPINLKSNGIAYTLIDYTENAIKPVFSTENTLNSILDMGYSNNLFIRIYDGKIIDVVNYME